MPDSDPDWERKVLETFIRDGRIVQIPARHKKRMVVLQWLADHFRPAERYSEHQVNELLSRYYDDRATLRRLLIDTQLMQRKAGAYWRTGTVPFPREQPPSRDVSVRPDVLE